MNIKENDKKIWGFVYFYDIQNKKYIGWTINLKIRHKTHLKEEKTNKHFHNSLRKYFHSGNLHIIESYYDIPSNIGKILNEREIFWIEKLKTYDPKQKSGWNLTKGGDGTLGRECLEETKTKISKKNKGRPKTKEWKDGNSKRNKGKNNPMFGKRGKNHPAFGRKHPLEEKRKISKALKGKTKTEKHKKNQSKSMKVLWQTKNKIQPVV